MGIGMTYFEMMNILEEIFPPATKCDYTKISPEELWKKAQEFLKKTGISNIDERKFSHLQETVKLNGTRTFEMVSTKNHGGSKKIGPGFDQNNWCLKEKIEEIKICLMQIAIDYICIYNCYNHKVGTEDQIREYISEKNIREYVTNILYVTVEDDDFLGSWRLPMAIILYHFGINPNLDRIIINRLGENERIPSYKDDELKGIEGCFFRAQHDTSRRKLHSYYDKNEWKSSLDDGGHDRVELDLAMQKVVDLIVEYVLERCNTMLNLGLEGIRRHYENVNKELLEVKPLEITLPSSIPMEEKKVSSEVTEEDFDSLISSFEEIERISVENKKIAQQLAVLEVEKIRLEEKSKKLRQQLAENNAKLTEKISRGSK